MNTNSKVEDVIIHSVEDFFTNEIIKKTIDKNIEEIRNNSILENLSKKLKKEDYSFDHFLTKGECEESFNKEKELKKFKKNIKADSIEFTENEDYTLVTFITKSPTALTAMKVCNIGEIVCGVVVMATLGPIGIIPVAAGAIGGVLASKAKYIGAGTIYKTKSGKYQFGFLTMGLRIAIVPEKKKKEKKPRGKNVNVTVNVYNNDSKNNGNQTVEIKTE